MHYRYTFADGARRVNAFLWVDDGISDDGIDGGGKDEEAVASLTTKHMINTTGRG